MFMWFLFVLEILIVVGLVFSTFVIIQKLRFLHSTSEKNDEKNKKKEDK